MFYNLYHCYEYRITSYWIVPYCFDTLYCTVLLRIVLHYVVSRWVVCCLNVHFGDFSVVFLLFCEVMWRISTGLIFRELGCKGEGLKLCLVRVISYIIELQVGRVRYGGLGGGVITYIKWDGDGRDLRVILDLFHQNTVWKTFEMSSFVFFNFHSI